MNRKILSRPDTEEKRLLTRRGGFQVFERKELPYLIATILLQKLPEGKRNMAECEKVLAETIAALKLVTLDSSELQQ